MPLTIGNIKSEIRYNILDHGSHVNLELTGTMLSICTVVIYCNMSC